ncbi:hypothetical protein V8G54_012858 [Vigna mungo]|uniref:Uncharacterized protein n=1 Tax=Vigna mungo TaxID=3915 RepID=A0AAQ3NV26_VIGMU
MDKILARSSPLPLNPVILDDIIGITRTDEALMVSSPKPRDNAQEVFALTNKSVIFISTALTNDLGSLFCASSVDTTNLFSSVEVAEDTIESKVPSFGSGPEKNSSVLSSAYFELYKI